MKSKLNDIFLLILLVTVSSCVSLLTTNSKNAEFENSALKNYRFVEGELKINIRNIKLFAGEELRQNNAERNIPDETKPTLKIWSADLNNHITQQNFSEKKYSPYPYRFITEQENGNTILYYDLSDQLQYADSIIISRKFSFVSCEYEVPNWGIYDNAVTLDQKQTRFYTKSERFLEQSDDLVKLGDSLVTGATTQKEKVEKIFNWIRGKMEYLYPPAERGVQNAFSTLKGDCGQYSYLFITLARIVGIPARSVNGFYFSPEKIGYHVWTEVFLDGYGWVPVDPTDKNGLFRINGHRLIASIGNNLALPGTPEWADYSNSEVENGFTDFMQLATFVTSGFEAEISTERNILFFSSTEEQE